MKEIEKAISFLSEKDEVLKSIISQIGACQLTKQENMFKFLVKAIIDQQLSIAAANSINNRIDLHFGVEYEPIKILQTSQETLNSLGISSRKIQYLYDLCEKITNTEILLENLAELDNQTIIIELSKVKGIATWTAKMFLIFVLGRTDVFPIEDLAFKNQLFNLYNIESNNIDSINKIQSLWNPYESIAAWYLWRSKDLKLK